MRVLSTLLLTALLGLAAEAGASDPADVPEPGAYLAVKNESSDLFIAKNYEALDARMEQYVTRKTRTASGRWVSGPFFEGVLYGTGRPEASHDASVARWDLLEKRVQDWAKDRPDSALARLTLAQVIVNRAWHIRGSGYASTVPASAWKPFREQLSRAQRYLDSESRVASRYPEYYTLKLFVAKGLGDDRKIVDAIFEEGTRRFPGYDPLYFSMVDYLLPKWHGDADQVEAFARDAVMRSRRTEGQGMYARIYWVAAQSQFEDALFRESGVHWKQMRDGFEDVIKRYPDQWNLQNYAHFACQAGDLKTLRKLLPRIERPVLADAWSGRMSFEACGRLAASKD
ncbi:MAG: DUF4034 domain-containing protein [Lysobacteraceae bacterium]